MPLIIIKLIVIPLHKRLLMNINIFFIIYMNNIELSCPFGQIHYTTISLKSKGGVTYKNTKEW